MCIYASSINISFQRNYTNKLRTENKLYGIHTLANERPVANKFLNFCNQISTNQWVTFLH